MAHTRHVNHLSALATASAAAFVASADAAAAAAFAADGAVPAGAKHAAAVSRSSVCTCIHSVVQQCVLFAYNPAPRVIVSAASELEM